jgi:hypothetical protein
MVSSYDPRKKGLVGYPFGSTPRLILSWIITEALRTGRRVLQLGSSSTAFFEKSASIRTPEAERGATADV